MLNSVGYEILNAAKYKISRKISRILFFSDSVNVIMSFCLVINVKMPTIVGILTVISRKNLMVICVELEHDFL